MAQHAWPWTMYMSQVQILAGLPNLKGFTMLMLVSIIFVLLSIAYSEFVWHLIKTGERPYENMDALLKLLVGLNYLLSIMLTSKANFVFAATCSLYQMVIFKFRKDSLTNGPVA